MRILQNLKPEKVFQYFEELSNIPRGSGNEKQVSDYLVSFGKKLGLETIQDEALNVIIKKPGTAGYENAKTVIIQGHMDMVCEKNQDTIHDFEKDPLKLRVVDGEIYATGTTLGADNGIAIAYAMAILDSSDIAHPPLEVLITTDEETGMGGAMAIDPKQLSGEILLNIDSEEEGKLLVSCAGGTRTKITYNGEKEKTDLKALEIQIRGLKGGHSGMEIDKERGNSNKLMGRILMNLLQNNNIKLVSINGGSKNNAIPRECDAIIVCENNEVDPIKNKISEFGDIFKNELEVQDPDINVIVNEKECVEECFTKKSTESIIKALYLLPNGINTRSIAIEGLVESSANLGVVITEGSSVEFDSALRSSVGSLKDEIVNRSKVIAEILEADFEVSGDYPEWQYNPNSEIREVCKNVYKKMTGNDPEIIAIHAGLECGLFKEKLGDIDMISFGPNINDAHTPNEHMNIQSVANVWEFLLEVLKSIK